VAIQVNNVILIPDLSQDSTISLETSVKKCQ